MTSHLSALGGSHTKQVVIDILSSEWPLTAKRLYNKLKKEYGIKISYQATHKALQELTEKKILTKDKDGYIINKKWIKELGEISEKVQSDLENHHLKREVKTCHKISFDNHREFIKFHLDFIDRVIREDKKLDMVFHYRHVPYPHELTNEEIKKLSLMRDMRSLIVSKKDTIMGRWCAKQWEKMGIKVKLGADISTDRRIILNNYIMDIYTTKEGITMWDKIYSVKNVKDFDAISMSDSILDSKLKTIVTVLKDKELATLLKQF